LSLGRCWTESSVLKVEVQHLALTRILLPTLSHDLSCITRVVVGEAKVRQFDIVFVAFDVVKLSQVNVLLEVEAYGEGEAGKLVQT
jgi:hypothetical protein